MRSHQSVLLILRDRAMADIASLASLTAVATNGGCKNENRKINTSKSRKATRFTFILRLFAAQKWKSCTHRVVQCDAIIYYCHEMKNTVPILRFCSNRLEFFVCHSCASVSLCLSMRRSKSLQAFRLHNIHHSNFGTKKNRAYVSK